MRKIFFLILLVFIFTFLQSEDEFYLTGKVVDEQSNPIKGVSIHLTIQYHPSTKNVTDADMSLVEEEFQKKENITKRGPNSFNIKKQEIRVSTNSEGVWLIQVSNLNGIVYQVFLVVHMETLSRQNKNQVCFSSIPHS